MLLQYSHLNMNIKMTIRQKLLLLASIAIVGMFLSLWVQYRSYSVQAHVQEVRAVGTLSLAAHELQKERGLTTMAPHGRDDHGLAQQKLNTDAALIRLAGAGIDLNGFRESLARLRTSVTEKTINPLAARDAYSNLLHRVINEMDRLNREPSAHIPMSDISSHAHLIATKEYLGQMRATLSYWIEHKHDNDLALKGLARLNILHVEELRKFRLDASPELTDFLDAQFSGHEVENALGTVQQVVSSGNLPQGLSSSEWWLMATVAIDRLKAVEDHSLQLIEKQVEKELDHLQTAMFFGVIVTVVSGLAILALALSATFSLLRALDKVLANIEHITTNMDFQNRIHADSPEEIGRISKSFNELLDIAERLLNEKDYLANTDMLTGTHNRLRFSQVLHEEAERKRRNKTPMALIMFDIDHFKSVNDTFGHNIGDEVLKSMAKLVAGEIRATDLFCRWGGEEFVLLLRDHDCDAAITLAEKLRILIESSDFPAIGKMTCSFGVTVWEQDDTETSFMARADKALYDSKRDGRNRVCFERMRTSTPLDCVACGQ